jgi:2-polyprenyl-3-methyl-5-hydroxy-6-metoxy-1,4-benzoquinol methylase
MELLPESALVRTSDLDQGRWNYHGVLGWVSRQRIRLVDDLLAGVDHGRLLEVGYGSGLFMPTLTRHCDELAGIDVHDQPTAVAAVLLSHGVTAELSTGSVTELPYPDGGFDTVVCISVLEFVDDLDAACRELRRVLAPGGRVVVVTPGHSAVLDLGLRVLTGERAEDTFHGRRQRIIPTLTRTFGVERTLRFPPLVPGAGRLYTALSLR